MGAASDTTAASDGDVSTDAALQGDAVDDAPTGSDDGASDALAEPACPPGALLCDDFEGASAPDPARWATTTPNCSGGGALALDGAVSHSGGHALRVDGGGGYCDHVFLATALGELGASALHARFWVRLSAPLGDGHTTFVAMRDATAGKDVRVGGQSRILMWNRESDDATLPELSPTGIALSRPLPTERWTCVELEVARDAEGRGAIRTWVDDALVPGLVVDGEPTADVDRQWLRLDWRPTLTTFALGWESYAGQALTLWFDDVVLAPAPIGCGPR